MPIEFLPNGRTGKLIPAQRVRSVYVFNGGGELEPLQLPKGTERFVSHWETCPGANEIKREQRAKQNAKTAESEP